MGRRKWQIAKLVKSFCEHYLSLLAVSLESPPVPVLVYLGTTTNYFYFLFSIFQTRFVAHKVFVWIVSCKGKICPFVSLGTSDLLFKKLSPKNLLFILMLLLKCCSKLNATSPLLSHSKSSFCDFFHNISLYVISNMWSTCMRKKLHVCVTNSFKLFWF